MDPAPDLALVELGGNDLLRGLSPAEAKANLSAILDVLKKRGIPVVLYGHARAAQCRARISG